MGVHFRDTKCGVLILLDTLYPFVYNSITMRYQGNYLSFSRKAALTLLKPVATPNRQAEKSRNRFLRQEIRKVFAEGIDN